MRTREFPKSWPLVVAVIVSLALLAAVAAPARAHSGRVFWAFTPGPPTSPADWRRAASGPLHLLPSLDGTGSVVVTGAVYVMNDLNDLYVLLAVPDFVEEARDGWVLFDNDHYGFPKAGDDGLRIKLSLGARAFEDQFRTIAPPCACEGIPFGGLDTCDGGSNDGRGRTTDAAGVAYFAFAHPLKSPDAAHDIQVECNLALRDVVGANFGARAQDFNKVGFAYDINDPSKWDDIVIACPNDPRRSPLGDQIPVLAQDISLVPDSAFVNSPAERRATLLSKVDEVGQMIATGQSSPRRTNWPTT